MKFIVSSSALLKQLSAIGGVIVSNPIIPILDNFLFEINDNTLKVTASDLQISVSTEVDIDTNQNGSVAIPAKMLQDTLRNLPEQPVTFKVDMETFSVEIVSDNGRYKLAGENAADFPKTPELKRTDVVAVSSEAFLRAIEATLFATSTDEMKPAMNGVYMQFSAEHTNFVSTDSHRLIRYRRLDVTSAKEAAMIIPKKALNLLKGSLPKDKTEVSIEFNDSNAVFKYGSNTLSCRLIDERFPDYESVIPRHNENAVIIDRQEMIGTLRRLVIYANKSTNQVRFKIKGEDIEVSAEDMDFANEASERLAIEHDGDDIEIGFNAKFLLEMLSSMGCREAKFKFSEPNRAALLLPGEQDMQEDTLMLVMPIMLSSYY